MNRLIQNICYRLYNIRQIQYSLKILRLITFVIYQFNKGKGQIYIFQLQYFINIIFSIPVQEQMFSSLMNSIKKTWNGGLQKRSSLENIIERVRTNDGEIIDKIYLKIKPIGQGAFAQCFITQNTQTKNKYATKIIPKEEKSRVKLLNQLLIHQILHHDNVVDFSHAFQDENNIYVFMELCPNDTLEHLLKKKRCLETKEIQSLMVQIIQGLTYIHEKNVIHRDLKPRNIFLGENNQIKIGDFGLAVKLEFEDEKKRSVCGTPQYMPPQMISGKGYGKQADIWALGILLYQIYTGKTPYYDSTNEKVMDNICNIDYNFSQKNIPKPALRLIKRILIKNPQIRPTLKQILQSEFFGYQQAESLTLMYSPRKQHCFNLNLQTPKNIKMENSSNHSYFSSPRGYTLQNNASIYVTEMEQIKNDILLYMLNDNTVGALKKECEILVLEDTKITQIKLENGKVNIEHNPHNFDSFLKTSLDYFKKKCKRLVKSIQIKGNKKKQVVYVTKITRYKNCTMLKLSNNIIQLNFPDHSAFLINLKRINEYIQYLDIDKNITQIQINDILQNTTISVQSLQKDKIVFTQRILRSLFFKQESQSVLINSQNMVS